MTHPFEKFGPAPYRFVDFWEMPGKWLLESNPEAWNNAMRMAPRTGKPGEETVRVGACHHCGTGILNHYILQAANKVTFIVGCDCVFKAASGTQAAQDVERHVKQRQKAQRDAKRAVAREAARKARESAWRRENAVAARARVRLHLACLDVAGGGSFGRQELPGGQQNSY